VLSWESLIGHQSIREAGDYSRPAAANGVVEHILIGNPQCSEVVAQNEFTSPETVKNNNNEVAQQ
jgi:hypothetical protein